MSKSYHEMILLPTFEERFLYLKCHGTVGAASFGFDRIFNQRFYNSYEWKTARRLATIRDKGCDLASVGFEIPDRIIVHHICPITMDDIELKSDILFDLDNLVCVSDSTHNAIHYGDESYIQRMKPVVRYKNDMCPWKH